MPLVHAMPISPGTTLTLDCMPAQEALELLRNILCATVAQLPGDRVYISGAQMVCAQQSAFKMQIQPSDCGQYIDFINLEVIEDGGDGASRTDPSADHLAGAERNA